MASQVKQIRKRKLLKKQHSSKVKTSDYSEKEIMSLLLKGDCIFFTRKVQENCVTLHQEGVTDDQYTYIDPFGEEDWNEGNGYQILSWNDGVEFIVENKSLVEIYRVVKATNNRPIYKTYWKIIKKNDCIENSETSIKQFITYGEKGLKENLKEYFMKMKEFIYSGFNPDEEYEHFLKILKI